MVLYIEYIIVDNFIFDYIIFDFIEKTFKIKMNNLRKFLSCLLSVFFALLLPYVFQNKLLIVFIQLSSLVLMLLVLKKHKNVKNFMLFLFIFGTYTCMLGGILWGIINLFSIEYSYNGFLIYDYEFPVSLIFVLFVIIISLLKKIIILLKNELKKSTYIYNIKFVDCGKEVVGLGFYDTGNNVTYNGGGVVIISLDMFLKLHNEITIEEFLMHKIGDDKLKNLDYIKISGLSLGDKYLSFTVDKIYIENSVKENVTVAVSIKNFDGYDCILHNKVLGGFI